MAGRSRGKSSDVYAGLQKLMRDRPDSKDAWEFVATWAYATGDDRTLAIMAATLLEHSLETAISTHFAVDVSEARSIFLDQSEGSISTFSMKIRLCYALGICEDKIKKELVSLKNLRNAFAHTASHIDFNNERISAACENLFIPANVRFGGLIGAPPQTAKQKYAKSVELIFLYMNDVVNTKLVRKRLLYTESDYYCILFLEQETSSKRMAREILKSRDAHGDVD